MNFDFAARQAKLIGITGVDAVALVRPLLFGEIPAGIAGHIAALLAVALVAFWIALTLIRRRLLK